MKRIEYFDNAIKNNLLRNSSDSAGAVNYTLACDYQQSLEVGNEYINFSGVIWEREVPEIAEDLRRAKCKYITISSTYTGLLNALALFSKEGYLLQGMTEVLASYTDFETGKPAHIPAVLLYNKDID